MAIYMNERKDGANHVFIVTSPGSLNVAYKVQKCVDDANEL